MKGQTYFTKETDSGSYADGYDIFLSRTNFRDKVLNQFNASLKDNLPPLSLLNVLDIGCGNGQMTKRYLETLKDFSLNVSLLEPSQAALAMASQTIASITNQINQINETADHYFTNSSGKEEFDLIIASYVFYHLSPVILDRVINSLTDEGRLVIMMGAKEHPLRQHPSLKSLSKHGDNSQLKDFLGQLESKNLISTNISSIKTDLDLNGLYENGELSQEGKSFFSFVYNQDLSNFSEENFAALKSTLNDVYTKASGIVHPTHEIIWVKKV